MDTKLSYVTNPMATLRVIWRLIHPYYPGELLLQCSLLNLLSVESGSDSLPPPSSLCLRRSVTKQWWGKSMPEQATALWVSFGHRGSFDTRFLFCFCFCKEFLVLIRSQGLMGGLCKELYHQRDKIYLHVWDWESVYVGTPRVILRFFWINFNPALTLGLAGNRECKIGTRRSDAFCNLSTGTEARRDFYLLQIDVHLPVVQSFHGQKRLRLWQRKMAEAAWIE